MILQLARCGRGAGERAREEARSAKLPGVRVGTLAGAMLTGADRSILRLFQKRHGCAGTLANSRPPK